VDGASDAKSSSEVEVEVIVVIIELGMWWIACDGKKEVWNSYHNTSR